MYYKTKKKSRLICIDTSTGEFYIGECHLSELSDLLSKYNPSEVVISKSDVFNTEEWYLRLHPHVTSIEDWNFNYDNSYRDLIDHFKVKSLKGFGCDNFPIGITSAGGLFTYLKNNLSMSVSHLKKIGPIQNIGIMGLDGFTIKNLEIFKNN